MSKRFGRNQRRKLRAELDLAHQAADAASATTRLCRHRLSDAEGRLRYIEDAARRLRYTALLPAGRMAGSYGPRSPMRLDASITPDFYGPGDGAPSSLCMQAVDLTALSYAVERHHEEWATDVHLFVDGRGRFAGKWSYRISDSALMGGVPPDAREAFVRAIGLELMEMVDHDIKARAAA